MGDVVEDSSGPVLIGTKLRSPVVRDQVIPRERLFERLRAGAGLPLSLVACPAGYGKTTLLAAWREAEAARKPVAWLTLDEGDNDPVVLWSYVIEALRRACPAISVPASPQLAGAAAIVHSVLPRLVNELDDLGEVTLILDDFDRLSDGAARESLAWFVDHAPPGFQLVLSTRTEPDLPLAALRAHGELLELRADDLRFTPGEADAFLNGRLGLGLIPEEVDALLERMEGWPAGLYLTALSLRRAADPRALVNELGVSTRHLIDFLETEVLQAHDPPMQALMLRSSVLGRLCGPLCDAVLEQQHSAQMLGALSYSNLFLISLDEEGGWYRFHPLFAQLLRVELERREPGTAPALHRRAYAWHRDHGMTGEAIAHAIAAGAHAEAAELIEASLGQLRQLVPARDSPGLDRAAAGRDAKRGCAAAPGQGVDALAVREAGGGRSGDRGGRTAGRARRGGSAGRLQLGRGEPDDAAGLLPVGRRRRPAGKRPARGRAGGPRVALAAGGLLGGRHGPVLPG